MKLVLKLFIMDHFATFYDSGHWRWNREYLDGMQGLSSSSLWEGNQISRNVSMACEAYRHQAYKKGIKYPEM